MSRDVHRFAATARCRASRHYARLSEPERVTAAPRQLFHLHRRVSTAMRAAASTAQIKQVARNTSREVVRSRVAARRHTGCFISRRTRSKAMAATVLDKTRKFYDTVAKEYSETFQGEHQEKPVDREILRRFSRQTGSDGPVRDKSK